MILSPPIDSSPDTRYSCWLAGGSDRTLISSLHWTATLPSIRSANVRSTRSHPREPASFELKRSAPTAALQPEQAKTRGEIPIAPAGPPVHTFRDFVPWRFSAAGHRSAWRAASFRRPKTCTEAVNHGPD